MNTKSRKLINRKRKDFKFNIRCDKFTIQTGCPNDRHIDIRMKYEP